MIGTIGVGAIKTSDYTDNDRQTDQKACTLLVVAWRDFQDDGIFKSIDEPDDLQL